MLGTGNAIGQTALYAGRRSRALLDAFLALVFMAFSFRLLNSSYAGPCIRVRRSSDNTQLDIGFVAGWLDVAALLTFVGAGSGYIVTWYDQSGSGRHHTNATTAAQSRIVNAGVLDIVPNLRPAPLWGGSSRLNAAASVAWPGGSMQSFAVFSTDALANRHMFSHGITGTAGVFITPYRNGAQFDWLGGDCVITGNGYNAGQAPRAVAATPGIASGTLRQMTALLSAAERSIRVDGAVKTLRTGLTGAVPAISGTSYFGAPTSGDGIPGSFAEFIMLNGALDPTIIEADQKSAWATP